MLESASSDRSTDGSDVSSLDAVQAKTTANLRFAALQQRLLEHLKSMENVPESITVKEKSQAERPSSLTSPILSLKKADAKDTGKGKKLTIFIGNFKFKAIASRAEAPTETDPTQDEKANDYSITAVHVPKTLYSYPGNPENTRLLRQMVAILIRELRHGGHSELNKFEFGNGSARYSDEFKEHLKDALKEHGAVVEFNENEAELQTGQSVDSSQTDEGRKAPPGPPPVDNSSTLEKWFNNPGLGG